VVEDGHVLGTVTLEAVERIPVDERKVTAASTAMTLAATVASSEQAANVLRLFADRATASVTVVDDGQLVGTVSRFDVARALRLQKLLASQHPEARLVRGPHTA
jgi:CBS domain-containing protein